MSEPTTVPGESSTLLWIDRRACLRYPCNLRTCLEKRSRPGDESWWPAQVRNISTQGVAIVVRRRFERGTVLELELPDKAGSRQRKLPVRVLRAAKQPNGKFFIGCAFVNELSQGELQALL